MLSLSLSPITLVGGLMRSQAPTSSGREIAEWIMHNRSGHDVKYIIWGQRIWESGDKVEAWTGWQPMDDRKSVTQNHW